MPYFHLVEVSSWEKGCLTKIKFAKNHTLFMQACKYALHHHVPNQPKHINAITCKHNLHRYRNACKAALSYSNLGYYQHSVEKYCLTAQIFSRSFTNEKN